MTRRIPSRTAFSVLVVALVVPLGKDAPSSIVYGPSSAYASPPAFAMPAFESTWRRTDDLVASGQVKRTWFWGPAPSSGGLSEEYKEGAGGKRLVQYFDKSRMEINNPSADPNSPWYVTNGLLTVELISCRMHTGHNVPEAMWTFLSASGPIEAAGKTVQQRLIDPWFYASGLPISDPYWAKASIAGKLTDVLVQAYERRVLTYVPSNPEGFKVEMGNVGQHYYQWRYSGSGQQPSPVPTQPSAPPVTISRFALDLNGDTSPRTLDGAVGAGIGAARIGVAWSEIEPNNVPPAQYNWGGVDNRLKRLADKGISPIVLLNGCPNWACTFSGGPIRVERVGDFVEFMSAMADHYGKAPYNTHFWEFWNEP